MSRLLSAKEVGKQLGINHQTIKTWGRTNRHMFPSGRMINGKWFYETRRVRVWQLLLERLGRPPKRPLQKLGVRIP